MDYILNEHNKEEFPPAHTAEHLLNQTMIRIFGCERSYNAHVERKKSKMSFYLDHKPSRQEEKEIERRMNELIDEDLPVTFEFVTRDSLPEGIVHLTACLMMPQRRFAWYVLATTMYVPVSASMYALLLKSAVSRCWVPIGMSMSGLSV